MIEKKPVSPAPRTGSATSRAASLQTPAQGAGHVHPPLFTRENYIWMLAGIIVIAFGMILMSGGNSKDPNIFDQKEVYSTTRITIAPLLIIIGLGLEVFAIFKKPKK